MPISTTYQPTVPSTSSSVGSNKGNREDLSSMLTMLEPEQTPITSLCGKTKASGVLHEWVVDGLDAPSADGINETSDVSAFSNKFANRARLGNYTQIFRKDYLVSDLQNASASVGPADVAQAKAKALREIKRNVEFAIASANDLQKEDGINPFKLRGLGDWIDSAGPSDVPAGYRTPAGSIKSATLTEATLNDLLGSIFSETGEMGNLTMVANVALRKVIANFTRAEGTTTATAYNVNEEATSRKITLSVSLFDTDFGVIKLVNGNPACMPTATTNIGYVLDPKYLGIGTLLPLESVSLENQGAGERGFVKTALTLICKSPQAHGKIAY
jgi:hypothetical protein